MGASSDFVRGLYDAFAEGDAATVLEALDPRLEWREAENFVFADRNPYMGPEAVAEGVFQRLEETLEDFSVNPERFIDGGDHVAVEGRYQGRVKSTGAEVDAQFTHVWQLQDGKVVRFQQYTDTQQWAEAFGA